MLYRYFGLLVIMILAASAMAQSSQELAPLLDFELPPVDGRAGGWGGGPSESLSTDSTWFWTGHSSGRLERDSTSSQAFSTYTYAIPVDFVGETIVYRGYLRSESVEGWAGLWMRIDGDAGAVAFDNMQQRAVHGSTEWTRYEITLALSEEAREIYFGALITGEGKLWVDALEIEVDGVPLAEVERVVPDPTPLDLEHEFDGDSRVEIGELSALQLENLVLLGRVWGFLKYHHPTVVSGQRHWDYSLFRVLPLLLEAQHEAAREVILEDWVASLGEVEPCEECASYYEDPYIHADLEWIHDQERLGPELSTALANIHRHRLVVEEQFYVGQVPSVGNPVFRHELDYAQPAYPDAGYRVLALYRFWNIIEYWFPYRDLIGEDWVGVLEEFLPRLIAAQDGVSYRREMMQLIARVHDTHANLWSDLDLRPPVGECQVPVELRFVEDQCVVAGFADFASASSISLRRGDEILAVDGREVAELTADYDPFYAASNQPTRLRDIARQLLRGDCGNLTLRVRRDGELLDLELSRVPAPTQRMRWHDRPGEAFQMLGEEIAYLKFSNVEAAAVPEYLAKASGTRGWVLDLRNYPSEFMVFALGQHLVEKDTEFVRFTVADIESPGSFYWSAPLILSPQEPRYEGKLVILVDEVTQSSAEYTSMAFRAAPGAIVVGSTTAAADGNISRIPLPGGLSSMISGIGVFYPDRRGTQRVGIALDVECQPTLQGIREGRDEVLEAALRLILGDEISDQQIQEMLRSRTQDGNP